MAARRAMRLRKEYLYRKSLEGKEKEAFERKKRIKDAMAGRFCLFPSAMHKTHGLHYSWEISAH